MAQPVLELDYEPGKFFTMACLVASHGPLMPGFNVSVTEAYHMPIRRLLWMVEKTKKMIDKAKIKV